jgi:hypothetical protein
MAEDFITPFGVPHWLDESFTYKKPHGFQLGGGDFIPVRNWRNLYEQVCRILLQRYPERFAHLLDEYGYYVRGKRRQEFTSDPEQLRDPIYVGNHIYAEGNHSANDFRNLLRILLKSFELELAVYWHESPRERKLGTHIGEPDPYIASIKRELLKRLEIRLNYEVESAGLSHTPLQPAVPAWAVAIVERAVRIEQRPATAAPDHLLEMLMGGITSGQAYIVSKKPYNILLDLQAALEVTTDLINLLTGGDLGIDWLKGAIELGFLSTKALLGCTIELGTGAAAVIYAMWAIQDKEKVEADNLFKRIRGWLRTKRIKAPSSKQYHEAITELVHIRAIEPKDKPPPPHFKLKERLTVVTEVW